MLKSHKIQVSKLSIVLLRMMLSLIFIVASLNHLLQLEKTVGRIESAKFGMIGNLMGPPEVAVIASGIIMLIAGLSLLIGFKTKLAAIALIIVLIPITLTIQIGQVSSLGPLFKNVAILGGLLVFALNDFSKQKITNEK
ncbi:MAG: DoxX family protein [Psychroflexus halocasei]